MRRKLRCAAEVPTSHGGTERPKGVGATGVGRGRRGGGQADVWKAGGEGKEWSVRREGRDVGGGLGGNEAPERKLLEDGAKLHVVCGLDLATGGGECIGVGRGEAGEPEGG